MELGERLRRVPTRDNSKRAQSGQAKFRAEEKASGRLDAYAAGRFEARQR